MAFITIASNIAFNIAILVIILLISKSVNKSAKSSLEKIKCVSDSLDLTCDIIVKGKDEISQISQALHIIITAFKDTVHHTKDVSSALIREGSKLNHVVEESILNSEVSKKKITSVYLLVEDVCVKLDDI